MALKPTPQSKIDSSFSLSAPCKFCGGNMERVREGNMRGFACEECGAIPGQHRLDGRLIGESGNCARYTIVDRAISGQADRSIPQPVVVRVASATLSTGNARAREAMRDVAINDVTSRVAPILDEVDRLGACWVIDEIKGPMFHEFTVDVLIRVDRLGGIAPGFLSRLFAEPPAPECTSLEVTTYTAETLLKEVLHVA